MRREVRIQGEAREKTLSGGWKEGGRRTTEQLKDGVARLGAGIYVTTRSYVIWALPRRVRESPSPSLLHRPAPDLRDPVHSRLRLLASPCPVTSLIHPPAILAR